MGQDLPHITDAELAVLQLLWDGGPSPVRPLADVLYPGGGPSEYATVHRLLERLESKGYVRRERSGGVYVFRPARPREEVLGQQLEALLEKMGGGSLQPLLTNLLRSRRLTPEELRELLALVDDLDGGARAKTKKRPN
jgi:BlaI family transcriptional regulator, penicillinase repressor